MIVTKRIHIGYATQPASTAPLSCDEHHLHHWTFISKRAYSQEALTQVQSCMDWLVILHLMRKYGSERASDSQLGNHITTNPGTRQKEILFSRYMIKARASNLSLIESH